MLHSSNNHTCYINQIITYIYGTARFKLQARVRVTRVRFTVRYEHFSKSCVSVGNCTGILRAMHARVMSACIFNPART